MKKHNYALLLSCLIVTIFSISCKKEVTKDNQIPIVEEESKKVSFLSLGSYQELNDLIQKLPSMSDHDYSEWKKTNRNFKSLYDRLLAVQSEIEKNQQNEAIVAKILNRESAHFYMGPDGRLRIKSAGELLSHYLTWDGLIKVGDVLMKYQNGNVYFTNYAYEDLVNFIGDKIVDNYKIKKIDISILLRNTKTNIVSKPKTLYTGNGYVGNSGLAQEYLFANRFESNNRRFYIDLIEEFLIMVLPYYGSWPNDLYWNIDYKLYIKFGHQKKTLFGWNSTQSTTYVSNLDYTADYPTNFASIFTLRSPVTVSSPYFTLPYGSNQYYYFSIVDPPNDINNAFNLAAQSPFTVNTANFSNFYIRATGDGNQSYYDKYYVTP